MSRKRSLSKVFCLTPLMSELEAAIEKQEQINRGLVDQVLKMDPATLQQRMMAAMQKDPARSQEIIEATQNMATAQGQDAPAVGEFESRKAKLMADYEAEKVAVMSLYAPTAPADSEAVTGHQRQTDPAVLAENNGKYRTVLCPKWFAKEVPALLASYRTYLVERRIPKRAAAEMIFFIEFGEDKAGNRSTARSEILIPLGGRPVEAGQKRHRHHRQKIVDGQKQM